MEAEVELPLVPQQVPESQERVATPPLEIAFPSPPENVFVPIRTQHPTAVVFDTPLPIESNYRALNAEPAEVISYPSLIREQGELDRKLEDERLTQIGAISSTMPEAPRATAPLISRDDIQQLRDVEDEEGKESNSYSYYKPHILARFFRALFSRFNKQKFYVIDVKTSRDPVSQSYASKPSAFAHGWQGLLGQRSSTQTLIREGMRNAGAALLESNGIQILSFRQMRYDASQMRVLFDSVENLVRAGFKQEHLDGVRWQLGQFSLVYGVDPCELANLLKMSIHDLLRAKVTPLMLHHYDIKFEECLADSVPLFDLAFGLGLSAGEFAGALKTDVHSLFNIPDQPIHPLKLNMACYDELARSVEGWTLQHLYKAGMSRDFGALLRLTGKPINHHK